MPLQRSGQRLAHGPINGTSAGDRPLPAWRRLRQPVLPVTADEVTELEQLAEHAAA